MEGRRNGIFKEFDADGGLRAEEIYVRGIRVPGRVANLLAHGRITARDILKIQNAAVRRICLEEFGYGRLLAQLPHEVIDREGEEELVKIDWHLEEEPLHLVKVKCPSTAAFYTLRVPPQMKIVREAVAWTFGLTEDQYLPTEET